MVCNVVNAKEVFYLRCIPEVKVVRAGDLKEGDILQHRLMYLVFKNEIDLTISEKPRRILKKHKLYLVSNDGKVLWSRGNPTAARRYLGKC